MNNKFCSKYVKQAMLTKLSERFQARRLDSKKPVNTATKGDK
jgi:hypothetical protein